MLVNQIIDSIEAQEKLASQTAPSPAASTENKLAATLGEALTKVASQAAPAAGDPTRELFKLAEEISNSEKQGEVQQAAMCGRAFAHAAIDEFRTYDNAAKVAAAQMPQPTYEQAVKVAASDDELMKAAELGYKDAAIRVQQEMQAQGQSKEAQMETKLASVNIDDGVMEKMAQVGYAQTQEKIAAEQYEQGYNSAMTEVRDRAAEEFIKGAQEVDALLQMSQQG
jgi:hypothetical protein